MARAAIRTRCFLSDPMNSLPIPSTFCPAVIHWNQQNINVTETTAQIASSASRISCPAAVPVKPGLKTE